MGYLKNKQINLLNLHAILRRFSASIIDIFGSIYFLQQGISLQIVLAVWLVNFLIRISARPISLKLVQKIGLKKSTIIGSIIYSGLFPIIAQVNGVSIWLLIFIIYLAIVDIFYWLPFHAFYASSGDSKHRGKELGSLAAVGTIIAGISPILGGFLIDTFGFWSAYVLSTIVMIFGVIPLFFSSKIEVKSQFSYKQAWKEIDKKGLLLSGGWAILYTFHDFLWIIIMFSIVGNFFVFGGLIGFQMFITAILFLLLGHFVDKGKGLNIALVGIIMIIIVIFGRAFYVKDVPSILIFEIIMAIANCFFTSSANTAFYAITHKSKNPIWFQFFSESCWDLGSIFSLSIISILVYFDVDLRNIMLLAIPGFWIVYFVLRKYFYKIELDS